MARKKREQVGGLTGKEWLSTYSDTVTLLLTFFVLLYSTSVVDPEKVRSISTAFSMMNSTGGTSLLEFDMYDGEVPLIGGESLEQITSQADISEKDKMYMNVKEFISNNNLTEVVEVVEEKSKFNEGFASSMILIVFGVVIIIFSCIVIYSVMFS